MPILSLSSSFACNQAAWKPVSRETRSWIVDKFTQTARSLLVGARPVLTFADGALLAGVLIIAFVLVAPVACASRELSTGKLSHGHNLAQSGVKFNIAAAVSMLSSYRRSNGLPAVRIDSTLMKMATWQTRAMVAHDQLSHDVGGPFTSRLRNAGYRSRAAAENISAGYYTLADAFSGWRDSPSHRANILLAGATRMGIAAIYAPNSRYKVFWSLILAEPATGRRRK